MRNLLSNRERVIWRFHPKEEGKQLLRSVTTIEEKEDGSVSTEFDEIKTAEWNKILVEAGVAVTEMNRKMPVLEDLFLELTGVIRLNKLIQNEMMKLIAKKRLVVIAIIISILVAMFTYAQFKEVERQREKLGTDDWRTMIQQTIIDQQNRISSARISDEWKKQLQIALQQNQYYLDHDINPSEPGAPTFMRIF